MFKHTMSCNKLKNIQLSQNCNLFIFSHKLSNRQFIEFAIIMLDVVNSLSIFCKVSQDRNISCTSVNDSLQKCLIKLEEFYDNPHCRENWKKRDGIISKFAKGVVLNEKYCQLVVRQLCREIKDRCDDLPAEVDLATKILQPSEWKHSEFFKIKSGSRVSPKYHPTKIFISDTKKITSKAEICLQLESKNIALSEILSEWTFLKLKLVKWSKNDFPQNHGNRLG